jgi:hypothetical protein
VALAVAAFVALEFGWGSSGVFGGALFSAGGHGALVAVFRVVVVVDVATEVGG